MQRRSGSPALAGLYGALGGIRTHDLSLRRAALYPTELQARILKCRRRDSNPHARIGHYALNVARLPFRHFGDAPSAHKMGDTGLEPVTSCV